MVEKLSAFAAERSHDLNELAHAWLLAQPQVSSVISGATRPEQVQANAKAAEWQLTTMDVEAIRAILENKS
jgi:aryl-alcohol dehydrogenase-like predicted oxidoreductase